MLSLLLVTYILGFLYTWYRYTMNNHLHLLREMTLICLERAKSEAEFLQLFDTEVVTLVKSGFNFYMLKLACSLFWFLTIWATFERPAFYNKQQAEAYKRWSNT